MLKGSFGVPSREFFRVPLQGPRVLGLGFLGVRVSGFRVYGLGSRSPAEPSKIP